MPLNKDFEFRHSGHAPKNLDATLSVVHHDPIRAPSIYGSDFINAFDFLPSYQGVTLPYAELPYTFIIDPKAR
jgi:hypothetical protein